MSKFSYEYILPISPYKNENGRFLAGRRPRMVLLAIHSLLWLHTMQRVLQCAMWFVCRLGYHCSHPSNCDPFNLKTTPVQPSPHSPANCDPTIATNFSSRCVLLIGWLFVVRARQKRRHAPCIENSFSWRRQHDDGCAAHSSLVAIKHLASGRCTPPPITNKLAGAHGSASPVLILRLLWRPPKKESVIQSRQMAQPYNKEAINWWSHV